MCNLNIVIKVNELNVTGFMQSVTTNSFEKNTDGDGFWCNKGSLVKSEGKVDLTNYSDELNKSNFIISHQRWATHGKVADMVQPFENDEFVFAHNGVLTSFYEYTEVNKSDSYQFITKFFDELNQRRELGRDEGICESLKVLLDGVTGSYSIVLFDKITQCLYYFKNSGTTIHGFHSKGYMFLTTLADNESYMGFINPTWETLKISEFNIHKIYIVDGIIKTSNIGELKKPSYVYVPPALKDASEEPTQTKLVNVNKTDRGDPYDPLSDMNNESLKGKEKCLCENCQIYKAKVFNYVYEMNLCRFCLREMTGDIEKYYKEVY